MCESMCESNDWSDTVKKRADRHGVCACLIDEDLPSWHFRHRGIKSGYRYCNSYRSAIISNLYWHNESVNIWSHYVAAVGIFLYFLLQCPSLFAQEKGHLFDKYLVMFVVIFGNVFPLLTSATCHNFYCIDKSSHKFCWFMDFSGIIMGMYICGIGYIYFSFYCLFDYMVMYLLMLTGILLFSVHWCWSRFTVRLNARILRPNDRFPEFSLSLSTFVSFASFLPLLITWLCRIEYFENNGLFWILVDSTISPILLALGVVLFAQGAVPERFFSPNVFDFVGHSHQLWHFTTAAVMFLLTSTLIEHFHGRVEYGCSNA